MYLMYVWLCMIEIQIVNDTKGVGDKFPTLKYHIIQFYKLCESWC